MDDRLSPATAAKLASLVDALSAKLQRDRADVGSDRKPNGLHQGGYQGNPRRNGHLEEVGPPRVNGSGLARSHGAQSRKGVHAGPAQSNAKSARVSWPAVLLLIAV